MVMSSRHTMSQQQDEPMLNPKRQAVIDYFQVFSEHPRLGELVTIPISKLYDVQCGQYPHDVFKGCLSTRDARLKYVLLAVPCDYDNLSLLELATRMVNKENLSNNGWRALCTLVVELHDVMVCALPPQGHVNDRKIVQAYRAARSTFTGWVEPFPRDCEAPTSGFPYYPEWGK